MSHPKPKIEKTVTLSIKDASGNPQNILVAQLPEEIQSEVTVFDVLAQQCSDKYYAKLQADLAAQAQQQRILALISQHYSEQKNAKSEEEPTESDA